MTEITLRITVPTPPNHVRVSSPDGGEEMRIRIADLSAAQMDKLASEWRIALTEAAERQR